MKPEKHVSEQASVVLYFDANMPEVKECRRGCKSNGGYLCVHRFGPKIWLISDQSRISFTRLSDLQVILDFIHQINRRWRSGRVVRNKHYVLVTHDTDFVRDAKILHESVKNMKKLPLSWGPDWVHFGHDRGILVRIHVVPDTRGNHDAELKYVLDYARSLRRPS